MERTITVTIQVKDEEQATETQEEIIGLLARKEIKYSVFMSPLPKFFRAEKGDK